MTIALTDCARDARFPLYGVRASRWNGPAFVGTVTRTRAGLRSVEIVYLDSIDESTMGLAVACTDGASVAGGEVDPVQVHLSSFVPRFDRRFVVSRMSARDSVPFPAEDFTQKTSMIAVAGTMSSAVLLTHKELPLQFLRIALRAGTTPTDVGIGAWRLDAITFASQIELVDPGFVKEFDLVSDAGAYPPSTWE